MSQIQQLGYIFLSASQIFSALSAEYVAVSMLASELQGISLRAAAVFKLGKHALYHLIKNFSER